jgi:hypothetical protein
MRQHLDQQAITEAPLSLGCPPQRCRSGVPPQETLCPQASLTGDLWVCERYECRQDVKSELRQS